MEESRANAHGQMLVIVTCSGGLSGPWHCININAIADCQSSRGTLPDWGTIADAPPLVASTADTDGPSANPSVVVPDDDEKQDTSKGKKGGKKGKKEKKGGKSRKR